MGRGSPTSTLSRASTRYHTPATSRISLVEDPTDPDEPLAGDFPVLIDSGPDFPSDSDIEDEACFCFVNKEDSPRIPSDTNGYGYDVGRGTGRDDIRCVIGLNIVSLLPPELGVYILSLLLPSRSDDKPACGYGYGLSDMLPCSLVCHSWYDLLQDNEIWYKAYVSWWGVRRSTCRSTSKEWQRLFKRRVALERRWRRDGPDFTGPTLTHLQSHTDSVYTAEFSLDWGLLVSGSRDRTIRIWDMHARSGRESCLALLRNSGGDEGSGHTGSVLCLKFEVIPDWAGATPDRQRFFMVSGSSDCTICVWDFTVEGFAAGRDRRRRRLRVSQSRLLRTLRGHSGGVLDLRLYDSADGRKWIVSCSKDASIRLWSRATYEEARVMRGHDGPVNAIGVHGQRVVSASGDGKMILWDVDSGERVRTFDGHDRGLACIEFKEDLILTGSNDCTIKVWCARTGKCLGTLEGHRALVRALAFEVYPAGRAGDEGVKGRVVSASYDRCVRVWDLDTGRPEGTAPGSLVREFKQCHTSHIFDVRFDNSRIVTTSHDQKIAVLDFARGLEDVCLL
ncbi:WD40-repeat-containing domain protein [Schizophyllum fasciatum]